MTESAARLRVRELRKSFDGIAVLRGISLDLAAGEVHAVLGENGSGKSTLVKILAGYHTFDSGEIALDGAELTPALARKQVTVIHQDLGLVGGLSVFDNIAIGQRFGATLLAPIRERRMRREVATILGSLDSNADLDEPVETLAPSEQSRVAVARALLRLESRELARTLFILDEPTALLTSDQAVGIISLMRQMAGAGATVLFISHRLSEAKTAADRITVLRDGLVVATGAAAELSEQDLITAMLGRRMEAFYPDKIEARPGAAVLTARGLSGSTVRDVALTLHAGEVVGVAGLAGMGQDELPGLLCAALPRSGGAVEAGIPPMAVTSYASALAAGIVLVPSDRRREGGWMAASAAENLSLPVLRTFRRHLRINHRAELANAQTLMARTRVVPQSPHAPLNTFSGGNQQKIVLAKWLQSHPSVLLLHEPTQGVDVGARRELIQLVNSAALGGAAVFICSNDYEQLAEVCQRVLVMHDGCITGELSGSDVTEQAIAEAAQFAATSSSASPTQ